MDEEEEVGFTVDEEEIEEEWDDEGLVEEPEASSTQPEEDGGNTMAQELCAPEAEPTDFPASRDLPTRHSTGTSTCCTDFEFVGAKYYPTQDTQASTCTPPHSIGPKAVDRSQNGVHATAIPPKTHSTTGASALNYTKQYVLRNQYRRDQSSLPKEWDIVANAQSRYVSPRRIRRLPPPPPAVVSTPPPAPVPPVAPDPVVLITQEHCVNTVHKPACCDASTVAERRRPRFNDHPSHPRILTTLASGVARQLLRCRMHTLAMFCLYRQRDRRKRSISIGLQSANQHRLRTRSMQRWLVFCLTRRRRRPPIRTPVLKVDACIDALQCNSDTDLPALIARLCPTNGSDCAGSRALMAWALRFMRQNPHLQHLPPCVGFLLPLTPDSAVPTHTTQPTIEKASQHAISISHGRRLRNLFQHYDPKQLPSVAPLLRASPGHEDALVDQLVQKYGPEPEEDIMGQPLSLGWLEVASAGGSVWYQRQDGAKQWARPTTSCEPPFPYSLEG